MGAGGGMVSSSQRDARSSSLQRMVRRCGHSEHAHDYMRLMAPGHGLRKKPMM